jgi:hypothetical protein
MRLTYLMRKKKIRSLFLQFSPYVVPWRSRRSGGLSASVVGPPRSPTRHGIHTVEVVGSSLGGIP